MFQGSLVALVTPMLPDGQIDYAAYEQLLEWHCAAKTSGIVVLGTTGESPAVTAKERVELIKKAVSTVAGRKPVIVGTGTNATASTIERTREAVEFGADAALIVNPYYNRPTQAGLYQHLTQAADSIDRPVILYNHPGRTGCNLSIDTIARLAEHPNIIAIKEALPEQERYQALAPLDIDLLGGNDDETLAVCQAGGVGVISVAANIIPDAMADLVDLARTDQATAAAHYETIRTLIVGLAVESNPIPVKYALAQMGRIQSGIRLPLTWLSEAHHATLTKLCKQEGLV
jgi:4-hydroxy-tetrahydrodipicolinate synthase